MLGTSLLDRLISRHGPITDPCLRSSWAGELVREIRFNEDDYDGPAVAEFALVMAASVCAT